MRGNVHQQDGVGAAVADVAAGGQLGLLLRGQALAAVRADQQPGRALARGGPVGVVGQRRDAVQRRVHPQRRLPTTATTNTRQQRQQRGDPNVVCGEAFSRFGGGRRPLCGRRRPVRRPTGRRRRCGTPGRWRRAPRRSLRVRWPRLAAVAGSSGRAGSPATAPGAPWGRDPGPAAGCRSQHECTSARHAASRGGPPAARSRRTRPSR